MRPLISYVRTGTGPSVVLLHGLGGDHRQSLDLLPETPVHGPTVTRLAPDLPGHGDTDLRPDEPVSFEEFAGHVAAVLDSLGLAAVPVVGVSMGAGVATTLAASRPDLVSRLVLIRPAWLDVAPPPHLAPFSRVAHLLGTLGPAAGAEAFRATAEFRTLMSEAPAMASSLLGQFARPDAVARRRVLAEMPASLPLADRDAYEKLALETLVVAAPEDPVHPLDLARTLSTWIPHARLQVAPRKVPDRTDHLEAVRLAVAGELTDLSGPDHV